MSLDSFKTRRTLTVGGREHAYYDLKALAATFPKAASLPYSLKILLENLLRLEDGVSVTKADFQALAECEPAALAPKEIAFTPARVIMQDFTGVPSVVGLAAMRDARGRALETPTTAELAYRPDGRSGLNFSLQPSTSDQVELGARALLGETTRLNVALFSIRTEGEIVIARNTGGRSSFSNAGDSSRLGAELMLESEFGAGLSPHVALTFLNARFDTAFRSCAPLAAFCNPVTGANTAVVSSGNRVPGVPNASRFADLAIAIQRSDCVVRSSSWPTGRS